MASVSISKLYWLYNKRPNSQWSNPTCKVALLWIRSISVERNPRYDTKCEYTFYKLQNNSACQELSCSRCPKRQDVHRCHMPSPSSRALHNGTFFPLEVNATMFFSDCDSTIGWHSTILTWYIFTMICYFLDIVLMLKKWSSGINYVPAAA